MIIETGHYLLILALCVSLIQAIIPAYGLKTGDAKLISIAESAAYIQLLLIFLSFLALTYSYVTSDFSVLNVWQNSHTDKPMLYKVSGVWGNHEGSMLLWVLILALFGALVALFGKNLPYTLKTRVLSVQASISVAFLLFVTLTSNPFERLNPAPMNGNDLNPLLQDPALAFHPPLLFAGYVGFSVTFSFAIAALLEGKVDVAWARWVRPWTLLAWMLLTVGIALGSWWAYYELGWGGWWFWDPVENASFMPWISGTALLHSAIVVEKRNSLKMWTILLSILTFGLSLVGTFLVRSGVLTSVHAFAVDPERGSFILLIFAFFIGGGLLLYSRLATKIKSTAFFAPISREGALVFNNLMLSVGCATVFIGTLYPLAYEAVTGAKLSVGAPFFNSTFVPLMYPLLISIPLGALLNWKRGDLNGIFQRLYIILAASALAAGIVFYLYYDGSILPPLGIGVAIWIILASLSEYSLRIKLFNASFNSSFRRAYNYPRSAYGMLVAHIGVGVLVLGIAVVSGWRNETIVVMKPNDIESLSGYEIKFTDSYQFPGPNYQEIIGEFEVTKNGKKIITLKPSKRNYEVRQMPTTETGIYTSFFGDLYIAMGNAKGAEGLTVRIYHNPFIYCLWLGAAFMFLGGALSLSDRRLRIGAPKAANKHAIQNK